MTTLCFNSVERDKYGSAGCNPEEDRIKEVQTQILAYGVEQKYMFKIDDILHKKNTPKVIRCLEEVAKLVSTSFSGTFTLKSMSIKKSAEASFFILEANSIARNTVASYSNESLSF